MDEGSVARVERRRWWDKDLGDGAMRTFVTGVAGFIGSNLADRLLDDGHEVVGVDSFTPYYDAEMKWQHIAAARERSSFELIAADLLTADLDALLDGIDVIFHLAGQPGVRASWGEGFGEYATCNILATQRLLEACRTKKIMRFVNSSSSSVYGNAERYPTKETDRPQPVSPYGVTKLAAEHLATLYGTSFGVPTVSLRYFTVYGPRQRPDMAMHRLVRAAMSGEPFPLNGDGSQARDFTYVGDVVDANIRAATHGVASGTVLNIGGGSVVTLREVISTIEGLVGAPVPLERRGPALGDPARTGADITAAASVIGWHPQTTVPVGLAHQVEWQRALGDDLLTAVPLG